MPTAFVLAKRELEAWFLGAKESLRGVRGIRRDAQPPPEPETIRGAAEALDRNMEGRHYLAVDDQPALAARFDTDLCRRRCPSFDVLARRLQHLIEAMSPGSDPGRAG